jgi:hypothetical protein
LAQLKPLGFFCQWHDVTKGEKNMGFRFRKSIKLLPGIRINLSKSGISTSIGVPGATINVGKRGTRGTVGMPGTGVSYSEQLSSPERGTNTPDPKPLTVGGVLALLVLLALVFSIAFTLAS